MKQITYKRLNSSNKGVKKFSISQKSEDKESKTQILKSFVYMVSRTDKIDPKLNPPQVNIRKSVDTKKQIERVDFQVKGSFYLTHQRMMLKVRFHHTLNIEIRWKIKALSPKKSAVLTK